MATDQLPLQRTAEAVNQLNSIQEFTVAMLNEGLLDRAVNIQVAINHPIIKGFADSLRSLVTQGYSGMFILKFIYQQIPDSELRLVHLKNMMRIIKGYAWEYMFDESKSEEVSSRLNGLVACMSTDFKSVIFPDYYVSDMVLSPRLPDEHPLAKPEDETPQKTDRVARYNDEFIAPALVLAYGRELSFEAFYINYSRDLMLMHEVLKQLYRENGISGIVMYIEHNWSRIRNLIRFVTKVISREDASSESLFGDVWFGEDLARRNFLHRLTEASQFLGRHEQMASAKAVVEAAMEELVLLQEI